MNKKADMAEPRPNSNVQVVEHRRIATWRLGGLVRIGSVAFVLAVILAATLQPFEWMPPRTHNGATYLGAGGLEFREMGIARTTAAPPWLAYAISASKLDIELSVDPASARERGPARILTLSRDIYYRNLTIGQESRDLVIRLRTPNTDANGIPPITIANVFGRPGWVQIRMSIGPERLAIWIDNELRYDRRPTSAPTKGWDALYPLALGNELSGDRAWLGKIDRAVVSAAGASIDYAVPGALEIPQRYWLFHRRFNFMLLTQTTWKDCLYNLLLFFPLGFVVGFTTRRHHGRANYRLILSILAFSTTIEVVQLGFAGRYPSLNDILFNTCGSVLGFVLALWLASVKQRKLF